MAGESNTAEAVIGAVASRSHGVVTRQELLQAGISSEEVDERLRRRTLLREHRGVYRVGHRAPSTEARYLAAVRAGGPGAVLSGRAAAHLLGLVKGAPPPPAITAVNQRKPTGVAVRRARRIDPRDATTHRGVPVTTAARTLVDLAAELSLDELARVCHEAGVRYRTTPRQVEAALARRPNSPGAAKLRRVLHGDVHVTLSRLEARFLELLRHAGLALPATNRRAGGRRVDCRWTDPPLTVELDGYAYHRSRHAWEQDRRREREARARGDDFRRYTYGDVFDSPRAMLAELRSVLPHRPPG